MKVTYSQKSDAFSAAEEIKTTFSDLNPKAVLFFASSHYDPSGISSAMKKAFPDAMVIGCSTSGEIVSGKMLKSSVVAMALESDIISGITSEVINLREPQSVSSSIIKASKQFESSPLDLDPRQYVGMILIDGLSCAEEHIMDKIGDLVNIPVVGGSAGDDLAFHKTWVYLDGDVFENSAIFTLIKPACRFDIIKTQSFCMMNKKLVPTSVDEQTRKVLEFNDKPAVIAYAEAIGVNASDAGSQFMTHPVGLISEGEPFVRSPQRIEGESIVFYCQILKGVDLEVLKSSDIIADTRRIIEDKEKETGGIKGIVNFNCILRTLQLEQENKCDNYGQIFSKIPTIGFSTYGEEYIGHINQTATMLIFY